MSIWLKRIALLILSPILCLLLLAVLLRLQVIQYWAAYTGSGFAKPLPTLSNPQNQASRLLICHSQPLKILTYNVRYGSALIDNFRSLFNVPDPGGYAPWSTRSQEIQSRINAYAPDLIGLQETQTDMDIAQIVSPKEYSLLTYHLGKLEYGDSALLFKTERFELLDSGQLWLGPNPNLPFSLGFKPLAMIRYVNWAKLRENATGFSFLFLNTHFDNNPYNKDNSSELFYQQLSQLTKNYPMIVTGDFNSKAVTERYQHLIGAKDASPHLFNTYDLALAGKSELTPHPNDLIDHILVGGPCSATADNWWVDKAPSKAGGPLSDHDPILVDLQFSSPK